MVDELPTDSFKFQKTDYQRSQHADQIILELVSSTKTKKNEKNITIIRTNFFSSICYS